MARLVIVVLLTSALLVPPLASASGGHRTLKITLTGRAAVPRGGKHSHARARIAIRGRRVCWKFTRVRGLDHKRKARAFIDKAIAGEFGPIMVKLGKRYHARGCVRTKKGLARQIALSPQGFYLTVNTRKHPLGAMRGQLAKT
jgi:CHRD domain-containing protein